MSDGRYPGSQADNNIPVLTEIVELDDAPPVAEPVAEPASAPANVVPPALREQGLAPTSAMPPSGTDAARVMGHVMLSLIHI